MSESPVRSTLVERLINIQALAHKELAGKTFSTEEVVKLVKKLNK